MKRCLFVATLFCTGLSQAGEWTHSPSLELALYETDIRSPNPDLVRSGAVFGVVFSADSAYDSKQWSSNLAYQFEALRFPEHEESDINLTEIRLKNQWQPFGDVLSLTHRWERYDETFDAVQRGFVDELYSTQNDATRHQQDVSITLSSPKHWVVPSRFQITQSQDDVTGKNETTRPYGTEQNNLSGTYFSEDNRPSTPFYWRLNGSRIEQKRQDGQRFINDQHQGVLRAPFIGDNVKLTGKVEWSRYENSEAWEHGGADRVAETLSRGVGLAWVSSDRSDFIQTTMDHVDDNDAGESWSWAADMRWQFFDRFLFSASKTYRFYGNAYQARLEYQGEQNRLTASYNENVRQRYVVVPELEYNGVYICEPGDAPIVNFDPSYCFLPNDGSVELEPGQVLLPDVTQRFPLESRLRLFKYATAKWVFTGNKWKHEVWIRKEIDRDLTNSGGNDESEVYFNGERRLNATSFIRFRLRYRDLLMSPSQYETTDRLYSVGYHKELNTRAQWSLSFQHMNKRTTGNDYTYDDNRIVLKYEHFFGRKNKNRRALF